MKARAWMRWMGRTTVSPRVLMLSSLAATAGLIVVCAVMLLDLRRDAWAHADQMASNVLRVVSRDIARNVEVYNLSLEGVREALANPEVMKADAELRQLMLFDKTITAREFGRILVLDPKGDAIIQSQATVQRLGNFADRDYFQVHLDGDLGLFVSRPFVSRVAGDGVIALSRRVTNADGSFGGVVAGTIKLQYFRSLFAELDVGRLGAIALSRNDGTILMREPFTQADVGRNLAGATAYRPLEAARSGSFLAASKIDGVERRIVFQHIDGLPLVLTVSIAVDEILSAWRMKAYSIGFAILVLAAITAGLALLSRRELERRTRAETAMARANAELAALSLTDALTGLPNRRRFDEAYAREWRRMRRTGAALSLLIVDADHFKAYNDRFGHAVGDLVLQGLAKTVAGCLRSSCDLACRIGGEEFAVILPDADGAGARRVAEAIHAGVAALHVPGVAGPEPITISIGAACSGQQGYEDPEEFFVAADAALYAAKRLGRNQTRFASAKMELPLVA